MRQAVCALIPRENGRVLGVSRKDNISKWGLIGGKVDEGETPEEALLRETFEETGLRITSFQKIFTRTDGEFECFTYLCGVEGEVSTNEKGIVKEVTWDELFEGPFGEYNRNLYNTFNHE